MIKYIQDGIRNNLRSIIRELTTPQQKAVQEMVRDLFIEGKPILAHLGQNKEISAKKQSEKYSRHLNNIDLVNTVHQFALRKAKQHVRKQTIIAYDLTDISKPSAKKLEKLRRVLDGSKRQVTNGFDLHGVGINGILTQFEVHDDEIYTRNQVRKRIIQNISQKLDHKGIWVFDRGNDDKKLFMDLRQELNIEFIARLKKNRQVVLKKTGEKIRVDQLSPGKYEIYLMDKNNYRVNSIHTFSLIIHKHLENKGPIRLLSSLAIGKFTAEQFVTMYLERWGVENLYRRVKTKFDLEKIRVMNYKRFTNLVALIQFVMVVSTLIFYKVQQATNTLTVCLLALYKQFLRLKTLTINIDSFISFIRDNLEPIEFRKPPPKQLCLFSKRQVGKMGMI